MTTRDPLGLLQERADAAPPVRLALTDQLRVPFKGQRGGDGPLTMGQNSALGWVPDTTAYTRMMQWPLPLPPGTTLADVAAALEVLMARHESLRTCFPADEPVQRVAWSGELPVEVYEASTEPADTAVLLVGLTDLLRSREFDLTAEWPLRVAVACWQGVPKAAVFLYSHVGADFASMVLIDRQFMAMLADPALRQVGPLGHQPLDQAADERSERGRRRASIAVRGWEAPLRSMPQCMYAVPAADPRHCGGLASSWLWSPAGALALPHIAARTGASMQQAVFASVCVMLAWRTGHEMCALPVAASNRYQRHLRDYVGNLAQECIISLDVQGRSLDEVIRGTAAAAVRGTRHSLVDVPLMERLIDRVDDDRGFIFGRYCVFNDLSTHMGDPEICPPGPDPAQARQALPRSRFVQLPQPPCDQLVLLLLQQVEDELVMGAMTRDANRVPQAELQTLLRGVEALLVAAASGDVEPSRTGEVTGIQPVERGPGWLRAGPSWVELAEVQRLVEDALAAPAAVFAVPGAGGEPGLVAYLTAANGIHTPGQAHAACMRVLAGNGKLEPPDGIRYTAITPGRYVICASPPGSAHDLAGWQRQPVLADGDGRSALQAGIPLATN